MNFSKNAKNKLIFRKTANFYAARERLKTGAGMLQEILNRHNFRFEKKYGQNFITDGNLLAAIVADSGITREDTAVEVGAGAGTLTAALASAARQVVSFEIDRNLKPVLEETIGNERNVELIFADVMKYDLSFLKDYGKLHLVANLPYYITTPVLMLFLESELPMQTATVMVQKEVADRLCAEPGTKEYGAVTVAVRSFGRVSTTRTVSRRLFTPMPNVDSAIVHIERSGEIAPSDPTLYRRLYRAAFAMRRKTLANNLKNAFSLTGAKIGELLERCGLPADVRGERLSPRQFCEMSELLKDMLGEG